MGPGSASAEARPGPRGALRIKEVRDAVPRSVARGGGWERRGKSPALGREPPGEAPGRVRGARRRSGAGLPAPAAREEAGPAHAMAAAATT